MAKIQSATAAAFKFPTSMAAAVKLNPSIFRYRPTEITNILDKAPSDNPVTFNGKKYALPHFRIKPLDLDPKGSIRMVKEDNKIFLRAVLQAYRQEGNVIPLEFRTIKIGLKFFSNSERKDRQLDLTISRSVYINQTNVLKDIHVELEIPEKYQVDLITAMTNPGFTSEFTIAADVWWQKPEPANTPPVLSWVSPPTPKEKARINEGSNINVQVNAQDENGIKAVKLWINNKFVGAINKPPFKWTPSSPLLKKLRRANYTLKAVAIDNTGKQGVIQRSFQVAPALSAVAGTIRLPATAFRPVVNTVFTQTGTVAAHPNLILNATQVSAAIISANAGNSPQRINVTKSISLNFAEDDDLFFVFGELMSKKYKWEFASKTVFGEALTIYYRRTRSEFRYKFLPQVFRLALNDENEPRIRLSLWEKDKNPANNIGEYRIAVECNLLPYVHPNARKDLMNRLFVEERRKYVDLTLEGGGHGEVSFSLNGGFRSLFVNLGGKEIYIGDQKIDLSQDNVSVPVNPQGFNLTFITTIESFGDLRRRFEEGNEVGEVFYAFDPDTFNPHSIADGKSIGIPVEINLRKFANLALDIDHLTEKMAVDETDSESVEVDVPQGLRLRNNLPFPVSIKGVDLTFLCKVGEEVYDYDMDLTTERKDFPLRVPNNGQWMDLPLEESTIKDLLGDNLFWTELESIPFGVMYEVDSEQVMSRIIDYANTESIPWQLKIDFPFSWDDGLKVIKVAITDMDEKMVPQNVQFKEGETEKTITVAKTLDQYLKTAHGFNRKYKYKRQFLYDGEVREDSEWKESSDFESDFLTLSPPPQKV